MRTVWAATSVRFSPWPLKPMASRDASLGREARASTFATRPYSPLLSPCLQLEMPPTLGAR